MVTDYGHLTLGDYQRILALDGEDRDVDIVAILAGTTAEEIMNTPLREYEKMRDAAAFLFYEITPTALRSVYKVGEYSLRPTKIKNITTAQYIDFKEWSKQEGDRVAEILAVLLVPEGCKYSEEYDVEEVTQAIREHLMMPDAVALRNFFTKGLVALMLTSLTSSNEIVSRMRNRAEKRALRKQIRQMRSALNGVGYGKLKLSQNSRAVLGARYMR